MTTVGEKKAGINLDPEILDLLSNFAEFELRDVEIELGDLELWFQPGTTVAPPGQVPFVGKPSSLLDATFTPPIVTYPGQITEVQLGATKGEGGSRGKSIIIGGEKSPAFYTFENPTPHPPIISFDVFVSKVPLAKALKMHFKPWPECSLRNRD